jgi:hypothetical protein
MAAINSVITTGRTLEATPSFKAAYKDNFRYSKFVLNTVIRITLFWIHIPNKAIKLMPADMLNIVPVISKAKIPPIRAKAMFTNTSLAHLLFLKIISEMRKTKYIVTY